MSKRTTTALLCGLLGIVMALPVGALATGHPFGDTTRISLLKSPAAIVRDTNGIAHVYAFNEHDLYFLQGYIHAHDRLFQMDVSRRTASGTLAALLGQGALPDDVQLRTLGLRRAAERSASAYSMRVRSALEAYTAGVNYFVFESGAPLPPEYGALGFDVDDPASAFTPWQAVDSLVVGKLLAFGLSFDLDDIDRTVALQTFIAAFGPLAGQALFFEDLYRSQPFDPASTVPDSGGPGPRVPPHRRGLSTYGVDVGKAGDLAHRYRSKLMQTPVLRRMLQADPSERGSNEWGISGALSDSGLPIIANDPHLSLNFPSTFYPMQLSAGWATNVYGSGFAGVPFIVIGFNRNIVWGATTNPLDVTDTFLDQLVPNADSPIGLGILFKGQSTPIVPIPESYFVNADVTNDGIPDGIVVPVPPNPAIPEATLTVPARNFGAIVEFDPVAGTALTVQYTGFAATTELETFYLWNKARNLRDFRKGLEKFDVGSQNWAYADRRGNLAYFASAEMPVREDLQMNTVVGLPPFFIRDGASGQNEWLPVQNPLPGQALPYEILPPEEMPHVINPKSGRFNNANNDPIGNTLDNNPLNELRPGGGIYYLSPGYASGFRAGRIERRLDAALAADGRISYEEMQSIQADVGLLDAEFFVPHILDAVIAGLQPGADPALAALAMDPRIQEATERMVVWGHSEFAAQTGIPEGYDAADEDGMLSAPDADEIANSVATTIYSVWRSSFIRGTIDATLTAFGIGNTRPGSSQAVTSLQNLLRNGGVSASGVDFFAAGGTGDAELNTRIVILQSLAAALDRLASDEYALAFGNSTDQEDYRWGKLHRIVFDSELGGPFSVPPAFGAFPRPLPDLRGIPTDGGFGVVDASSHNPRAGGVNGFMFGSGPTNRLVVEMGRWGVRRAESVWPGGTVAIAGSEYYLNQLPFWLTNDTIPLWSRFFEVYRNAAEIDRFWP